MRGEVLGSEEAKCVIEFHSTREMWTSAKRFFIDFRLRTLSSFRRFLSAFVKKKPERRKRKTIWTNKLSLQKIFNFLFKFRNIFISSARRRELVAKIPRLSSSEHEKWQTKEFYNSHCIKWAEKKAKALRSKIIPLFWRAKFFEKWGTRSSSDKDFLTWKTCKFLIFLVSRTSRNFLRSSQQSVHCSLFSSNFFSTQQMSWKYM